MMSLKVGVSNLIAWEPIHFFFNSFCKNSFRIIYYHIVSDNDFTYYPGRQISTSEFRKQLKWLKKRFQVISVEQAISQELSDRDLKNCLAITFDDGFRSCYDTICPILAEENMSATFYLTTDCIDNKNLMWRNKLFEILKTVSQNRISKYMSVHGDLFPTGNIMKDSIGWDMKQKDTMSAMVWDALIPVEIEEWLYEKQPYMNSRQITSLLSSGFYIGSHTKTHPMCSMLTYPELEDEIIGSAKYLEENFFTEIISFAYPFGKRATLNFEKSIIGKSGLKTLLGVRDALFNKNENLMRWERCALESHTPHYSFYITPLRNKWGKI